MWLLPYYSHMESMSMLMINIIHRWNGWRITAKLFFLVLSNKKFLNEDLLSERESWLNCMLAVLASESSPATALALFKTNVNKFCACTKLQFNSITVTNLTESSQILSHTEKLPNNLESLKLYLYLI